MKPRLKTVLDAYGYNNKKAIEALEFAAELMEEYAKDLEITEPYAKSSIKEAKESAKVAWELSELI